LRANEEHYRDLVENSFNLICTHDLNGVLLTVNLAAARTLGYEPSELVNRNLRELISPKVHEEFDAYLVLIREKGAAGGFLRLRTKNGETRIWKYNNTLRTEGVQVPIVRGMAHDLTDILRAQKALRESEERLRVAAEVGRMYAWEWDPATDAVLRSAECADILGLDGGGREDSAKGYFTLVHPDDRARVWSLANSLTPQNVAYRTEYRKYRPDGSLLWLEESGRATFDKDRKMIRLVGMTADVTERKQAEEKLRASEERSRRLVQGSPVAMIVTHGAEQNNELVNEKFTALFGYSMEDVPGVAQWWSLAYPDEAYREAIRSEWQARVTEAIKKGGEIAPMEAKVCCKDGSYRHIEFHFASLGETNLVSFVDLTDHKSAEEALAKVGGRLLEAQEEERTRIARDLHDDINQRLALLGIELEQLGEKPPASRGTMRRHINKLHKRVQEISSDVEAISHELHSSKLELLGLTVALRMFCKEFSEAHKVNIEFVHESVPDSLPRQICICLFRVAQEALRNGVKHSKADQLQVKLSGKPGAVHLSIRDAGVGFEPETAMYQQGLGLISMRERINLVKGTIAIRSKPQGGTEIHCKVPLESKAARNMAT
jgi:PAS domain S-box-containing protein